MFLHNQIKPANNTGQETHTTSINMTVIHNLQFQSVYKVFTPLHVQYYKLNRTSAPSYPGLLKLQRRLMSNVSNGVNETINHDRQNEIAGTSSQQGSGQELRHPESRTADRWR